MTCWKKDLQDLKRHPFTTIGLSDREKFHTGMLAHTIQYFWENKQLNLIETLWGDGTFSEEFAAAKPIQIDVEKNSVDLVVTLDKQIKLFAEVKFKTTLHSQQMGGYAKKLGFDTHHEGIILGLFEETDEKQSAGFKTVCFPEEIVNCFKGRPDLLYGGSDDLTLIRLWVNYLKIIRNLQSKFQKISKKLKEIPDAENLTNGLDAIKLKGIFERFRYNLVSKNLITLGITTELFNSNGNAGMHVTIATANERYSYGLQWQSGALKLFIEDKDFDKQKKNTDRDSALKKLASRYYQTFPDSSMKDIKLNRTGKFRSVTVARWNIMMDIAAKAEQINARLKFLQKQTFSL